MDRPLGDLAEHVARADVDRRARRLGLEAPSAGRRPSGVPRLRLGRSRLAPPPRPEQPGPRRRAGRAGAGARRRSRRAGPGPSQAISGAARRVDRVADARAPPSPRRPGWSPRLASRWMTSPRSRRRPDPDDLADRTPSSRRRTTGPVARRRPRRRPRPLAHGPSPRASVRRHDPPRLSRRELDPDSRSPARASPRAAAARVVTSVTTPAGIGMTTGRGRAARAARGAARRAPPTGRR